MPGRTDSGTRETASDLAAVCAARPSARWRLAGLLAGAALGLLTWAAYALGWVGETAALFVVIGLVVGAKAAFGGLG